ncbi:NUMOD3 domain-containing DNA-binding protein [Paraburkholderia tropica]|uniref:NUMOD3 domain-containing DNA-binding protein n=1 Tax=Paraburkholderia tropica TaxID=92647 RepID=UPI00239FE55B|nr:NUMOD3 domain-containing DNA-binding protein [Paraburkholderia tropica]
MTIIYALLCPESGEVRYVGKTSMNLARRLSSHIMGCECGRDQHQPKNKWLAELVRKDLVPLIRILERVPDGESWEPVEMRWIAHYRAALGKQLLNSAIGGHGPNGYVASAETRAKISASGKARAPYPRKPHSAETKAKIAATLTGRPGPMTGKKHSPETLAKMAAAREGRKLSESHRAKLSEVRNGHEVSPEARAKIGAKVSAAAARKRAEKLALEAQT